MADMRERGCRRIKWNTSDGVADNKEHPTLFTCIRDTHSISKHLQRYSHDPPLQTNPVPCTHLGQRAVQGVGQPCLPCPPCPRSTQDPWTPGRLGCRTWDRAPRPQSPWGDAHPCQTPDHAWAAHTHTNHSAIQKRIVYGSTKGFVSYGGFTLVGFPLRTSVSLPPLYPSSLQLPLSPLSPSPVTTFPSSSLSCSPLLPCPMLTPPST